jgi:hypothetical protein
MCAVLSEYGVPISPSSYYEWVAKAPTRRELRDEDAKKPRRQLLDSAATSMSDVQRNDAPLACRARDRATQSSAMLRSSSRAMVSGWLGNC